MTTILLFSLILTLPKSAPTLLYIEPTYKTCGEALNKRLTRVCKNDINDSNSQTLTNNELTSSNYTFSAGRNETKALRSLFADCCNNARGCSDIWIRDRYCMPMSKHKRDASQISKWNESPLHSVEEYACFQTDAFYYNWWSDHEGGIIVEKMKTADPAECHELCNKFNDCRFWSFSYQTPYEPYQNCILKTQSGGGDMRFVSSASGPDDCVKQEVFRWFGPIDTCIEFANNNTEFHHEPRAYFVPLMIPFNPRFSDPNQFNMLTIKLKVHNTFTLYIAPKVSEDFHEKVLSESADPKKMFKNAYTVDVRYKWSSPRSRYYSDVVVNHMTDGEWSDEEGTVYLSRWLDYYTLDELNIQFLPSHIRTYIRYNSFNKTFYYNTNVLLTKPAWFDTVENIWFKADDKSIISNFFHCTSGLTVPLDFNFTHNYQLDFKHQMSVGTPPMTSNYVVFYGIVEGIPGDVIEFEFLTSGPPNYDTAFTFSVRYWSDDMHIAFNSKVNGTLGEEIRFKRFPFFTEKSEMHKLDRIDFMFASSRINVAIDGTLYGSFNYRAYQHVNVIAVRTTWKNIYGETADFITTGEILFKIIGIDVKWISVYE